MGTQSAFIRLKSVATIQPRVRVARALLALFGSMTWVSALADVVTYEASGTITVVRGTFSQPVNVGDTWTLTYTADSNGTIGSPPPEQYTSGTLGTYVGLNTDYSWQLTVGGNTLFSTTLGDLGGDDVSVCHNCYSSSNPINPSPTFTDSYGVTFTDLSSPLQWAGTFGVSKTTLAPATPSFLTSAGLPEATLDLSNTDAANDVFSVSNFATNPLQLEGTVTSLTVLQVVPIPTTILLLLSGIGGLSIFKRRNAAE